MSSLSSFAFLPGDFFPVDRVAAMTPLSLGQTGSVPRYAVRRLVAASAAALLAGCTGSRATPSTPAPTSASAPSATSSSPGAKTVGGRPAAPRPTYHGDNLRSGASPATALTPPLRRDWSRSLDGAVYAQPIAVAVRGASRLRRGA